MREYAKALQKHTEVVVLHIGVTDPTLPHWWATHKESDDDLTDGVPCYRAVYRCARMRGCSWPRYWVSVLRAAAGLAKEYGPFDLIHAHIFSAGSAALWIGRWYGIPVVISEHFSGFARGILSPSQVRQARRVFRRADAVLPVSQMLQRAIEQYGIHAAFRVVPNTVNTDLFCCAPHSPAPDGTVRVLAVTSFAANKGLALLLRALSQARWQGRPWHLDVVGGRPGPEADAHRQMTEDLGMAARVTFHGPLPKREVARMMHGADLFVLPSLVETFSVATAEALAAGVPVLVTRCGGPEEFVDERCGLVVTLGDANALAEGLSVMLDRLATYDRSAIARSAKERFGHEAVAALLEAVYAQVVRP